MHRCCLNGHFVGEVFVWVLCAQGSWLSCMVYPPLSGRANVMPYIVKLSWKPHWDSCLDLFFKKHTNKLWLNVDQSQALHALLPYPTRVHLKFQKRSWSSLSVDCGTLVLTPTPVNVYDHPRRNPWKIRLLYFESYSRYLMWILGKIYMKILPKILEVWGPLGSRRSMFTFLMVPSHIWLFWTIDNNFSFLTHFLFLVLTVDPRPEKSLRAVEEKSTGN